MNPSTGVLTIDLAAVQKNWRRVNQELGSGSSAAAVIKANAYGLGAEVVGPALYAVGCREFFVATLEEGIAARDYLSASAVIYVLGGARVGAEALFLQHRLVPVLFTLPDIQRWQRFCAAQDAPGVCAIKIDTGMTRLGLDISAFQQFCQSIKHFDYLQVALVMSHLACADEFMHPLNRQQLDTFQPLVDMARLVMPQVRFSLANSSGVFLGKDWHFDLVRPGAALYGINPTPEKDSPVSPVIDLRLPVLQARWLQQPVSLGYGATVTLGPPARILVAAGGYADGLHRTLGGQGVGEILGRRIPVVGRISMDTTLFDATELKDMILSENDMIEVCNKKLTVDYLAGQNQALGYEILTSLGSRYQRQYLPPLSEC